MKQEVRAFDRILSLESKLAKLELIVAGTVFFAMISLIMVQVICRFILHVSTPWAEELVRFTFIVVSFLGAGVAILRREHIEITIIETFIQKIKAKEKRMLIVKIIEILRHAIIMIVIGMAFYYGWDYTWKVHGINQMTSAAHIPMWIVHFLICIGYISTILHSALRIAEAIIYPKDLEIENEDGSDLAEVEEVKA